MSAIQDLPRGWVETTLGQVHLDVAVGVNPARTPDQLFELYSVPSHGSGVPEVVKGRDIGSNKQAVEPHTVLLCKINPRINRVWVTGDHSANVKIASTEWIPFFPLSQVEPRFLAYYLRQGAVRDFLAGNASGVGGSLMRVRAATLRDFCLRLAPTAEQERIADAIDELFSDLDAGVAALERAREKLKRYRASVLKAAVEGALTAEWRERHPHAEPASELLKRILVERRRRWEEDQLAKFKAKGQEPPKNWKAKYKEPVAPDTKDLPSLPEGWCWTTLDALLWRLRSGSAETSVREPTEYPVLKSSAVRQGTVDLNDLNYFQASQSSCLENFLRHGDLLVTRLSGSVDYVGCAAIVTTDACEGIQYPDRIFCGKVVPGIQGTWLTYCFRHSGIRRTLEQAAKSTAGHQRISLSDLLPLSVPLAPFAEQEAIVEAVEDQLSVVEHLEADIDAKLKSAQALRQAILRHAFTGKLVPQDPSDEPASELLKRIAAEREARARDAVDRRREQKRAPKPPLSPFAKGGRRGRKAKG